MWEEEIGVRNKDEKKATLKARKHFLFSTGNEQQYRQQGVWWSQVTNLG